MEFLLSIKYDIWSPLTPKIFQRIPCDGLIVMCEILCRINTRRGRYEFWLVSGDSILVLSFLHIGSPPPTSAFESTNKKIWRCFVIKWFGLKCIHRFILCENWRVCDTFGPIFPGAHCRVRPPWFTFPKSVRNPFLWDVKHFQISHLSEVNNVESFSELGESRTVYNRPPTNSSNSLQ